MVDQLVLMHEQRKSMYERKSTCVTDVIDFDSESHSSLSEITECDDESCQSVKLSS